MPESPTPRTTRRSFVKAVLGATVVASSPVLATSPARAATRPAPPASPIAYVTHGGLGIVRADGGHRRLKWERGRNNDAVRWSPDRERLIVGTTGFDGPNPPGTPVVYDVETETAERTPVPSGYGTIVRYWGHDWSPDGRSLAYGVHARGIRGELRHFTFAYDHVDENATVLQRSTASECRWDPHADHILVRPGDAGEGALRLLRADGSGGEDFVQVLGGPVRHVDWVEQGARVVFTAPSPDGSADALVGWSVPRAGGEPERIFSYRGTVDALTWHPDGRWVAIAAGASIQVAPVAEQLDPVTVATTDGTPTSLHWG